MMNSAYSQEDLTDWYRFNATGNVYDGSVISMADWLEKPAGSRGRVMLDGGKYVVNGEEIKLWGLNNNFGNTAPTKDIAKERARFYAKYGINIVRLHKSGNPAPSGIVNPYKSMTDFDPEMLDRFDYYTNELRENGVYYSYSLVFKMHVGPEDRDRIPAFDEIFKINSQNGKQVVRGDAYGLVYAAPALQDLLIDQLVNLLKHKCPYAGMTHAENPALAYVEIINEDNLYFYHAWNRINRTPYYKKLFSERFSEWLRERYGSQEELEKAWGRQAFNAFDDCYPNESLADKNIIPMAGPWFLDPKNLNDEQAHAKRRLLDTAEFYFDIQNEFYAKAEKAMRDAGYKGPVVGSNWISRSVTGHLWNLKSDAKFGPIDRHAYHAGQKNKHWQPVKGEFSNLSMMGRPGTEVLSLGYMQVLNRPFQMTEWIHVFPNEWAVEGPAVIGAYGMGLQGWDLSTMFSQSQGASISESMHASKWDAKKPNVIAAFPAISRQVLRQDVKEADVIGAIRVSDKDLQNADFDFDMGQDVIYDVKAYTMDKIPNEALAIGKVGVEFTGDKPGSIDQVDPEKHKKDGAFQSTTGQLAWYPGEEANDGFITINTPGTKALVGFLPKGKTIQLDNVTIQSNTPYAAIYVTALEKDASINRSRRILITAVARARNEGMQFNEKMTNILDFGKKNAVIMEPVSASIKVQKSGSPKLILLDHEGVPTDKTLPVSDGEFKIDGSKDKTMYYLLEY